MLHNFLACSGGIHFEAATCELLPLGHRRGVTAVCGRAPRRALYQELLPSWIKRPPSPLSSSIFTYFPDSAHIINSILTGRGFTAIGSSDLFTSVWIKAGKCPIAKLPHVELCNANALIGAMKRLMSNGLMCRSALKSFL